MPIPPNLLGEIQKKDMQLYAVVLEVGSKRFTLVGRLFDLSNALPNIR